MPYAELTITVPEAVWIGNVSRRHPEVRFRVLAATANDSTGVARIELLGPDLTVVCEEMREYDAVADLTIFEADRTRCRIGVETTTPLLLAPLQASGVPIETPFEISDGEMRLETTIPGHRLSELGDQLEAFGIHFLVERIEHDVESEALLTDRQRRLLREAIDRGYYDTPRRITLTELAEELDIAASTCCEVLHRAEGSVLKEHLRNIPDIQRGEPVTAD